MRAIFEATTTGGDFNVTAATRLGVERARDGVSLSSVMEAYRVGFRRVWEVVAAEAATLPCMNGDVLRTLTAQLLTAQDVFTAAMAAGYRQEQTPPPRARRNAAVGAHRRAAAWPAVRAVQLMGGRRLSSAAAYRSVRGDYR